jgi:hypothetical protein
MLKLYRVVYLSSLGGGSCRGMDSSGEDRELGGYFCALAHLPRYVKGTMGSKWRGGVGCLGPRGGPPGRKGMHN